MPPRKFHLHEVFKHVNMLTGPEFTDPDTGEISRCWPWTLALNDKGRPYFTCDNKKYIAYRLVYELVTGKEIGKDQFNHKCDNPACCNPAHGTIGTHQDNMNEMKQRARHGLPHHTVRAIRKLCNEGNQTREQVGKLFGIARQTVDDIANMRTYADIGDE